jgi:hypothetical protein
MKSIRDALVPHLVTTVPSQRCGFTYLKCVRQTLLRNVTLINQLPTAYLRKWEKFSWLTKRLLASQEDHAPRS